MYTSVIFELPFSSFRCRSRLACKTRTSFQVARFETLPAPTIVFLAITITSLWSNDPRNKESINPILPLEFHYDTIHIFYFPGVFS